jgi:ketosteroid isomerase-like protein
MSRENVDLVRRVFGEFSDSPVVAVDDAARAGLLVRDIEFDLSALYPDGPILRGVEAWRGFADTLPWGASLTLKPERFYDVDGERVLVFVHATAEGKGTGVPVENRTAHVFTIRDGVFVRWKVYADRAEALEAAGLRE